MEESHLKREESKNQTVIPCPPGENSKVIIYEENFKPDQPPTLILGFAGLGLVGSIAVDFLVKNLDDIERIGHLRSTFMPSIVPFYDGVLKQPFRLYYSKKNNIILGFCEVPFKGKHFNDISFALLHWAINNGVKDVVVLQGLGMGQQVILEEQPVYCAAEIQIFDKIKQHGVELLPKGLIMGMEASILIVCLDSRLDGYALITPVSSTGIPSPEGAAALLKTLADIYGLTLDVSELEEEGHKIKEKMKEMAQFAQRRVQLNAEEDGMGRKDPGNQIFV